MSNILRDLQNGKREIVTVLRDNWLEEMVETNIMYPFKEIGKALKGKKLKVMMNLESK